MKKINIGICGWGNVATGLYKAINKNHELKVAGKKDKQMYQLKVYSHQSIDNPNRLIQSQMNYHNR